MEWYYAKHGKQEGPVELSVLQSKLQSGQILPTDLVWREGMAEWTPAGQVTELAAAPAASPESGPTVAPGGHLHIPASGSPAGPVAHEHIPNYLVWSILVTIFCCWPFGIPAIVFAAKVDGMVARGDIPGALNASRQAKMWTWISFGIGLAAILAYVCLVAFGALQA